MGLVHTTAQLVPSKMEMLGGWIGAQSFWPAGADPAALEPVARYRFDDPEGEVGIETHLVRAGDAVLQVPLTYRGAPLAGGEDSLVGTLEHSVLGTRWVYDGAGDPVYVAELARVVLTGDREVDTYAERDGVRSVLPHTTHAVGSGVSDAIALPPVPQPVDLERHDDATATTVRFGDVTVTIIRRLGAAVDTAADVADDAAADAAAAQTLTGEWPGASGVLLATVRTA
jgi:hypothetical protein